MQEEHLICYEIYQTQLFLIIRTISVPTIPSGMFRPGSLSSGDRGMKYHRLIVGY